MARNQARSKCDMTIQNERGQRTRFECESDDDFRVKAYQHCCNIWKSKGRFGDALLKDLRGLLEKFTIHGSSSFELCGLVFIPSIHIADNNSTGS
jgi:hypothetical protein